MRISNEIEQSMATPIYNKSCRRVVCALHYTQFLISVLNTSEQQACLHNRIHIPSVYTLINTYFHFYEGIHDVFEYSADQFIPFVIKNQPNPKRMCHFIDETKDMDLVFTFAKCKNKTSRSRLIWRYTIMCETDSKTLETAHGYFKLQTRGVTILKLSKSYDIKKVKWLYFVVIDPVNPMKRAWFNAIRGPAFGKTEIVPNPVEEHTIVNKLPGKNKLHFCNFMIFGAIF